jgi:hypothetical protein
MAQRDTSYTPGRNNARQRRNAARARDQAKELDDFKRTNFMLQKSPSARDHSSLQIEINKLIARLTIAEANIAELTEAPVPRRDDFSRTLAVLALLAAIASMAIAKLHL